MKRFYRKALIYLLAVAMVAPAWLANGMFSATKASAAPVSPYQGQIYLNEVSASSSSSDWAELYNEGDAAVDLSDWHIVYDGGSHIKHLSGSINSLSLKVFDSMSLSSSGDTIKLLDNNDLIVDTANYDVDMASRSYGRVCNGCDAWVFFSQKSQNANNYLTDLRASSIPPTEIQKSSIVSGNFEIEDPRTDFDGLFVKIGLAVPTGKNLSDIFEYFKVKVGPNWITKDISGTEIFFGQPSGFDIRYGHDETFDISAKLRSDLTYAGPLELTFVVTDSKDNFVSPTKTIVKTINDTDNPVITVNPTEITVEKDSTYDDSKARIGVTALDNKDGDITPAIVVVNSVNTAVIGSYVVTYDVSDAAGNEANQVTRTVNVVDKAAPVAPLHLVAVAGNGEVSLSWDAVAGASGYVISYKKTSDSVFGASIPVSGTSTKIINLTNGVSYDFRVAAVGSNGVVGAQATTTASPVAPKTVSAVTTAPVVGPVASVAPATVQAAPVEQKVETPSDDNGQIKGEEENTSEKEDINWTPWIVLFVLILLAGAATGGYFYWFAGSEDEENKPALKEEKQIEKKVVAAKKNGSKAPNRKSKRW